MGKTNKVSEEKQDLQKLTEFAVLAKIYKLETLEEQFLFLNQLGLDDFTNERYRGIFQYFTLISRHEKLINNDSFIDFYKGQDFVKADEITKFQMEAQGYTYAYIENEVGGLKALTYERKLNKLLEKHQKEIKEAKDITSLVDIKERMAEALNKLHMGAEDNSFNIFDTAIKNYTEDYYNILGDGSNNFLGVCTGLALLDKTIKGLRGLIILAGEPKTGKTSYILQVSSSAAEKGTPVIFYSLEMARFQLITRDLSRRSEIDYMELMLNAGPYLRNKEVEQSFNDCLTKDKIQRLKEAEQKRLAMDNYYIRSLEDPGKIDFKTVEREINLVKRKHGTEDILVIIDHLQVFPLETSNYRDQLDKENNLITRFNEIQKRTGATIVLVSQKNKGSFSDNATPNDPGNDMAGVKGSVDLVYLASLIMQLRNNKDMNNGEDSPYKDLILSIVSRDTKGGHLGLVFNGETQNFEERPIKYDEKEKKWKYC